VGTALRAVAAGTVETGAVETGAVETGAVETGSVRTASAASDAYTWGLRELTEVAEQVGPGEFHALVRGGGLIRHLLDQWGGAVAEAAGTPLTVHDAIAAAEIIERSLLALSLDVGEVELCHAAANGMSALVALAEKWRRGTPYVMSEHGVYLRERYLALRAQAFRRPVKALVLGFLRRLNHLCYTQAELILPVSRFNRRWEERLGADPASIVTVYNGVEPATFTPIEVEPVTPTITWVGRIDPLKDLETLIRAFAVVRRRRSRAVLRLFGPVPAGNESYRDRVVEVAGGLGVSDAVDLAGPVRGSRSAFLAGHLVALSSISEGLPFTVIEAMMCGRATVSTDVGGVSEAVGDAGLIVPPRDPHGFADACLTLLDDRALRHRLGVAARQRALSMFTLDTFVDTFRVLYDSVAGGSVPARAVE
jgi:polysaccharide biosynthesis protein PelF